MQPNVNADLGRPSLCNADIWQLNLKEDIPLPEATLDNNVLDLGIGGNLTVVLDLNLTDVLDVEQCPSAIIESELAPIAVGKLNAMPAPDALKAREAWRITRFYATKEGAICFVETPKRLLHTREVKYAKSVRIRTAEVSKVLALHCICNTRTRLFVHIYTLLKSGVVHVAREVEQIAQLLRLARMCVEAILICPNHAPTQSPVNVWRNSVRPSRRLTTDLVRWP